MERTANFSKSSSPGEYASLIAMTASGWEDVLRQKSLQLFEPFTPTTRAYGTTANATTNPTIANQCMVIQRTTNYEEYRLEAEDTSGLGVSFVFLSDLSSLAWTTETHNRTRYCLSGLFCGTLVYPERQLRYELVAPPESPWMTAQVIPEEEEQETIRADTNQALSFKDLVSALDRISRPTEIEDIPLPFDPDDYPVV